MAEIAALEMLIQYIYCFNLMHSVFFKMLVPVNESGTVERGGMPSVN